MPVKKYLLLQRSLQAKYRELLSRRRRSHASFQQSNKLIEDAASLDGHQLLFVTGFDKSGTTWVMHLLDAHPQIYCQNGGRFFNYYGEDVHFLSKPGGYLQMVDAILEQSWYKEQGSHWLTDDGVRAGVRQIIVSSMRSFATDRETVLVGDKSTVQDCFLIREVFPKAYIVAIVRDGRDIAVSFAYDFKRRGKPDKFNSDGKLANSHLEDVAKAWSIYNEHILKFNSFVDKRFCLLKYENLLAETESCMKQVLSVFGLSNDQETVLSMVAKNTFERLSGGRKPGEEDSNSFFRKGVAGDWKNHLNQTEAATFHSYAGKTLQTLGY